MLPSTPLIFGCPSHFMKTPVPITRIFCYLHDLSRCSAFIIGQPVVVKGARFDAAAIDTERKEIRVSKQAREGSFLVRYQQ